MKPLPSDPYAFQARIMAALIGDILDRDSTTFKRLDALREVLIQTTERDTGNGLSVDQ